MAMGTVQDPIEINVDIPKWFGMAAKNAFGGNFAGALSAVKILTSPINPFVDDMTGDFIAAVTPKIRYSCEPGHVFYFSVGDKKLYRLHYDVDINQYYIRPISGGKLTWLPKEEGWLGSLAEYIRNQKTKFTENDMYNAYNFSMKPPEDE